MSTPEHDLVFSPNSPIYDNEYELTAEGKYYRVIEELTPAQQEAIATYVNDLLREIRQLKRELKK